MGIRALEVVNTKVGEWEQTLLTTECGAEVRSLAVQFSFGLGLAWVGGSEGQAGGEENGGGEKEHVLR